VALEPPNHVFTGPRRRRAQVQVGYEQTAHGPNPTRIQAGYQRRLADSIKTVSAGTSL
jgi:hypothetical protein